jgi:3-oxoacyl-[acyl-carrier protein] reductase
LNIDLKGKKAIVAGGSRGIGRSIALAFAGAGADVSICARGVEALHATEAELKRFNHQVHAATCDLGDGPAVTAYVKSAAESLGGVDILVNNASGFGSTDDEAGWAASINVDLMATVRASYAAIPFLEKSKGSILNISSIAGLRPSMRTPPYAALKAAVIQYTTTQAAQLAPKHVRVNCIAPGSIEFPGGVWDQRKTDQPKLYNAVLASIKFGRLGTPEDIANVALFLSSSAASWVTGQTIVVDGGQLLA